MQRCDEAVGLIRQANRNRIVLYLDPLLVTLVSSYGEKLTRTLVNLVQWRNKGKSLIHQANLNEVMCGTFILYFSALVTATL